MYTRRQMRHDHSHMIIVTICAQLGTLMLEDVEGPSSLLAPITCLTRVDTLLLSEFWHSKLDGGLAPLRARSQSLSRLSFHNLYGLLHHEGQLCYDRPSRPRAARCAVSDNRQCGLLHPIRRVGGGKTVRAGRANGAHLEWQGGQPTTASLRLAAAWNLLRDLPGLRRLDLRCS
jgi:hypothetical protein